MLVRPANQDDATVIAQFNQAMALETESKHLQAEVIQAGVETMIADPALGFYLVVEHEGRVIACLGVTYEWSDWRNGLFWWIQSVYVAPGARRIGAFSAMYAEVMNRARAESNVCGVRLYVEKDNRNAEQTYLSLGMHDTEYKLLEISLDKTS